jgi:hypothetical protein
MNNHDAETNDLDLLSHKTETSILLLLESDGQVILG